MNFPENFPADLLPEYSGEPVEKFLLLLEKRVAALIENNPEKLRQILYRMDVSESDAGLAACSAEPAKQLAQLIWQREQQKAKSRATYKSAGPIPDADLEW